MSSPTLIDALLDQVHGRPDHTALWIDTSHGKLEAVSWKRLGSAVAGVADELARHLKDEPHLQARIGHASDNTVADILIALASQLLGTVEVPIDHRLREDQIQRRWNRVGGFWVDASMRKRFTSLLFESPDTTLDLTSRRATVDMDAPSLILWTTGTTAQPRGVTLSQRNLAGNAAAKLAAVPQRREDVRLTVLPLCHAYARTCDLGTWLLSGCELAVTLGFSGLRRLAPVVRPTLINAVPRLAYRMLAETVSGLERLRLLGCGGAAISETAFANWTDRGVTVIQGYGLTETSPVICSATPQNAAAGMVGCFVDGWEHQLRDGQLFVRGPHTMLGYWEDESATRDRIDEQGWLATGDLVEKDESSGQLRVLGRVDEVIILDNGTNLSPSVIEREVECVEGIRHAMLIMMDQLELWCDAATSSSAWDGLVADVLSRHPEIGHCQIRRFAKPLSQADGELTSKGTICRARIISNRFPNHAGS